MSFAILPNVYVVSSNSQTFRRLKEAFAESLSVKGFDSPLDLLAACIDAPPLLVIAEVTVHTETWLVSLQAAAELEVSSRRLFLVEPGVLQEVMHETYRAGVDHLILSPCSDLELTAAVQHMLNPGLSTVTVGLPA